MTTFDKIVLLPEELRILKKLKNGKPHDFGDINFHSLFVNQLIEHTGNGHEVKLKVTGRQYLIWLHEDIFRNRWPVYISIASLVVSLFSLVMSGVSIGVGYCILSQITVTAPLIECRFEPLLHQLPNMKVAP